jgi:CBS domain-containing protein
LQSWQKLPVSAIANFQPVVINGTAPVEIENILNAHSFAHFPVMVDGKVTGIVSRHELIHAVAEKRPPRLAPAKCCEPRETVRELQTLLLDSPTGIAIICDGPKLLGIVTLRDLLRAQMNAAQNSL